MTYCVGVLVREGLVMVADTRTNAGIDNVATFRKLTVFENPGERAIAIATAGNLATSQAMVNLITEGVRHPESDEVETIASVRSMGEAASLVGRAIRHTCQHAARGQSQAESFEMTALLGGQIGERAMRLFMIYAAGNFIEATVDTPYLQIGEHKYGKPILDRAVTNATALGDALKLALISMDSTMRSNLGVGLPIDLAVVRRDALALDLAHRIDREDAYFQDLRERWSSALRAAHQAIPMPPYGKA